MKRRVVHEIVAGGYCRVCGDVLSWLRECGAEIEFVED